jgi:transcriptional regulator with AAA-type ATPase domain
MNTEFVSGLLAEMPFPFPEFFISSSRICLFDLLLERLDKRLLVHILSENQGDRLKAAEYLEMEYPDLCLELEKHHLIVPKT